MAAPLLAAGHLRKSFAGAAMLDIDALALAEGQIVAISGDNGAGKTTLLRVLAGLDRPDAGARLSWRGQAIAAITPGRHANYLHQQPYMLKRTTLANVVYVLRLHGRPAAEADELLDWAGLAGMHARMAAELSGGEQRRLALARIRATAAPLVLLDEPTANLDSQGARLVSGLIGDLAAAGRAVVCAVQRDQQLGLDGAALSATLQEGRLSPALAG